MDSHKYYNLCICKYIQYIRMCMEQINRGGKIWSRKEYLKTAEVKVSLYIVGCGKPVFMYVHTMMGFYR